MKTISNPQMETVDADLYGLFRDELADIYDAEQQLIKALPQLMKAADWAELRTTFQQHLEETQHQIARLQQVFAALDEEPRQKTCLGMKGLLEEGGETMVELEESSALDAALIVAAQKVEHYEMASYGALIAWAEQLGQEEVVTLLKQNLEEEKKTEGKLTALAATLAQEPAD